MDTTLTSLKFALPANQNAKLAVHLNCVFHATKIISFTTRSAKTFAQTSRILPNGNAQTPAVLSFMIQSATQSVPLERTN